MLSPQKRRAVQYSKSIRTPPFLRALAVQQPPQSRSEHVSRTCGQGSGKLSGGYAWSRTSNHCSAELSEGSDGQYLDLHRVPVPRVLDFQRLALPPPVPVLQQGRAGQWEVREARQLGALSNDAAVSLPMQGSVLSKPGVPLRSPCCLLLRTRRQCCGPAPNLCSSCPTHL